LIQDFVEYRKRHEVVKVKLVDNTVKTVLIDTSASITDVVGAICKKIGIKNYEEYSLQGEGSSEWLKNDGSLLEQVDQLSDMLYLKKKYFVSDSNVDKDDPVQLHLVYTQAQSDIVAGKHPTSRDEAVQLAALQAQIDGGNINIQNPNLILKNVMAPQWNSDKANAPLVINEWKKLTGMTELNAKFRYVQFCRSLKTYGITLFHVKSKIKGSRKLAEKLLGFTRDSIIFMDEDCKTVEKTYPLKNLRRWAAAQETFTLDFGSHEDDYTTVITQEGEAISQLIAG
jgi:talin